MGGANASQYTSIVAMIVESELLYTAYLILFIVPFIRNDSLVNVFVQGPALIQVRLVPSPRPCDTMSIFAHRAYPLHSPSPHS